MQNERRVMRVTLIMLLCITFCFLQRCASADVDVTPVVEHDAKIIAELRRQVEALPKDKQLVAGTKIVLSALDKLMTTAARQNVLVSLGDLYAEQGLLEESGRFYGQASDVNPGSELAAYSRLKAAGVFMRGGKNKEAYRLIDELQPVRKLASGKAFLDENVVAAKVDVMINRGQLGEAIAYCENFSREYPDSAGVLLIYAEKVPLAVRKSGKDDDAIAWYERIHKTFRAAKLNPQFSCNYIAALRSCDFNCTERELERLQRAIDDFSVRFPNDINVPVFCAAYADALYNKGDNDGARTYYSKALKHPKVSRDVKGAITRVLGDMDAELMKKKDRQGLSRGLTKANSNSTLYSVAGNLLLAVAFGGWLLCRNRGGKKP